MPTEPQLQPFPSPSLTSCCSCSPLAISSQPLPLVLPFPSSPGIMHLPLVSFLHKLSPGVSSYSHPSLLWMTVYPLTSLSLLWMMIYPLTSLSLLWMMIYPLTSLPLLWMMSYQLTSPSFSFLSWVIHLASSHHHGPCSNMCFSVWPGPPYPSPWSPHISSLLYLFIINMLAPVP